MNLTHSNAIEAGAPHLDPRAFRRCLGQFGTGVTIMTTTDDGQPVGMTANSFSSLSIDPPLVLWSVSRSARSFKSFESASHFAVNILAANQVDLSQRFASSEADKFSGVEWLSGSLGVPVIRGTLGILECEREAVHDGGDHIILVGRVKHFARFAKDALLFAQGRYAVATEHPDIPASSVTIATPKSGDTPLITLLFYAHNAYSAGFDEHRRSEGLTIPQNRVLFALWDRPGLNVTGVMTSIYLAASVAEDTVAELIDMKLITRDAQGSLNLTSEGQGLRKAMIARVTKYEAETLSRFSPEEVRVARRFLERFTESIAAAT